MTRRSLFAALGALLVSPMALLKPKMLRGACFTSKTFHVRNFITHRGCNRHGATNYEAVRLMRQLVKEWGSPEAFVRDLEKELREYRDV